MAVQLSFAEVEVLYYDQGRKTWVGPEGGEFAGGPSVEGRAYVYLLEENGCQLRIIAERLSDRKTLVNQDVRRDFRYRVANALFHQWKDAESQRVYGLNFLKEHEANTFQQAVKTVIENLQYHSSNNPSNGVYQDPQMCYQQRECDRESIGSGHSAAIANYRQQQQKASYSSLQNAQAGTLNQQQRRCSQGSSGSSGTSNIYATAQHVTSNGYAPQINSQPPPQAPPVPTPSGSNGIAPIKAGVAPPPPPPPPPQLLNGTSNNPVAAPVSKANVPPPPPLPTNLADQLKNATLRKTSNAQNLNNKTSSEAPSQAQPKTSSAGGPPSGFLEELNKKFSNRNNAKTNNGDNISNSSSSGVSSSSLTSSSDTSDSGATIVAPKKSGDLSASNGGGIPAPPPPKTWPKSNGITAAVAAAASSANGSLDSPKGPRKVLSSNSVEGVGVTVADLESKKSSMLTASGLKR